MQPESMQPECMQGTSMHGSPGFCGVTGWWDRLIGFKQRIGYMAQGEQRVLDKAGRVYPYKDPSQHILVTISLPALPLPLSCPCIALVLPLFCPAWPYTPGCPVCMYSEWSSSMFKKMGLTDCHKYWAPNQVNEVARLYSLLGSTFLLTGCQTRHVAKGGLPATFA